MNNLKFHPVSIAFACNDPDTGNDTGKFSSVNIGDDLLELDNKFFPPKCPSLKIRFDVKQNGGFAAATGSGSVKISRRRFPIFGYKYGWGNWCWDLVIVTPETAIEIINYLKELDCFTCDSGETNFFNKFNSASSFEWTDAEINLLKTDGYQRP